MGAAFNHATVSVCRGPLSYGTVERLLTLVAIVEKGNRRAVMGAKAVLRRGITTLR